MSGRSYDSKANRIRALKTENERLREAIHEHRRRTAELAEPFDHKLYAALREEEREMPTWGMSDEYRGGGIMHRHRREEER